MMETSLLREKLRLSRRENELGMNKVSYTLFIANLAQGLVPKVPCSWTSDNQIVSS